MGFFFRETFDGVKKILSLTPTHTHHIYSKTRANFQTLKFPQLDAELIPFQRQGHDSLVFLTSIL
jgi:hypothetical protein